MSGGHCGDTRGHWGTMMGTLGAGDDAERDRFEGALEVALERQVWATLGVGCEGIREMWGMTLHVVGRKGWHWGQLPAVCSPEPPVPMAGLKQELFHRHKEAQQCCRPHNLPLLRAAQQREMEVRGAGLEIKVGGVLQSCVPSQGSHNPLRCCRSSAASPEGLAIPTCSLRRHQLSWLALLVQT